MLLFVYNDSTLLVTGYRLIGFALRASKQLNQSTRFINGGQYSVANNVLGMVERGVNGG